MSSPTTNALSRQPLAQVLRNITDPRDRRGVRHSLSAVLALAVTGVLAGCRSLTAIWEHTTDLTATGPGGPGTSGGPGPAVGVDHPQGAPGPGPHRPQHPSEVLVLYAYRHHRGENSHRGASARPCVGPAPARTRRLISWRPWTRPPARSCPRLGWQTSPTRSRRSGNFLAPRPGRGGGERRRHAHPGRHRPVDSRSGWSLPSHCQEQPARCSQDTQEAALEELPVRLERRYQSRAAGATHRQGPRGSRLGGPPRGCPGGPDPAHQNHQEPQERGQERQR